MPPSVCNSNSLCPTLELRRMLWEIVAFLTSQQGLVICALIGVVYYLSTYKYDTFAKQGVEYVKPWPFLGSFAPVLLKRQDFYDFYKSNYDRFSKSRFFGIFEFNNPVYIIRDPELIKQIAVKDFDGFMNHRMTVDEDIDPYFGRNLAIIRNQKWRDMRSTLSPAFTGSKMRMMFGLLRDCADRTIKYLLEEEKRSGTQEMEMKEFFTRFANDSIATAAFGIEVNSFKDKDNEFFKNGEILANLNAWLTFKFFLSIAIPKLMKLLRVTILDKTSSMYMRDIIMDTMSYREANKVTRPDMINLLLQAKHKGAIQVDKEDITEQNSSTTKAKTEWTNDDLVAQSIVFFLAGFDTTSTLFSFLAYELAVNPDIQRKLQLEVEETAKRLNGFPITHEAINNMKYLDQCVSEALRKWPPAATTDRQCTKKFVMEDYNGTKVTLNPGDGVAFPIIALQRDPKYFPQPEKFDPERFSDENRDKIDPFTNFPFGVGPRICIGSRFALMEAKVIFYYLLSHFNIETCERMQIPLKLKKNNLSPRAERGIWLRLKAKQ